MINNILLAFLFFLIASFTDFLDGYFARYLEQESILGANLDLLADKIFVSSLLIFISFHFDNLVFLRNALVFWHWPPLGMHRQL